MAIFAISEITFAQKIIFTDPRDGKKYKTVQIGTQIWMAENLFHKSPTLGVYCYNDDTTNCYKDGGLYQWEMAQKACPEGWHLPSKFEFERLLDHFGGDKKKAYHSLVKGGDSGFEALFTGWLHMYAFSEFSKKGQLTAFWSSTDKETRIAECMVLSNWGIVKEKFLFRAFPKDLGLSVRCVKK